MYKKLKGLFLILVFSIQLLPVMQVGLILANGQLTEEQCSVNEDQNSGKETLNHLLPSDLKWHFSNEKQICLIPHKEQFTSRHSDDIQTPPPNL